MASNATCIYADTPTEGSRTIRLIHLHGGSETDPVHISLVTADLDAAPAFEAISYCWGDVTDQRDVTCNGTTTSITNSLFTGLVHFRHLTQSRVLWADAICINQADPVEKCSQVLLMPYIYTQAKMALVWLGVADDPVHGFVPHTVVASIKEGSKLLPNFDPENATELSSLMKKLERDSQLLLREGRPSILTHDWMPIATLLARPWFFRRWVVQEVSLARRAILYVGGGIEVRWTDLAELAFKMETLGLDMLVGKELARREKETPQSDRTEDWKAEQTKTRTMLESLPLRLNGVSAIYMIQMYQGSGTLLDGILVTVGFKCSNPRDHVYSLLSLVSHGPTVQPDYTASVSDVFRRFSIATLVEGQSLKILSLAPDKSIFPTPDMQRLEGLPSWVPDLQLVKVSVMASYTVRPQAFFAGGHGKPMLTVSQDERILTCQGRVVDTAKIFSASLFDLLLADMPELRDAASYLDFEDPVPERRQRRLARWLKNCHHVAFGHDFGSVEITGPSPKLMAFSRTMVCGVDAMRNRLSPNLIAAFPRYMQWAIDRVETKEVDLGKSLSAGYSTTIHDTIMGITALLKFCLTESGRFGQLPLKTQAGDCICVLVGGETPFVIRPTGRGTYTMIGECYVDGVMDGEALEDVADELLETISFE